MKRPADRRIVAALIGLGLGVGIALAANVTYGAPRGAVTLGLGIVAPLVLPVTLYIRTLFQAHNWWDVAARELATLAVAGPAAGVSYWHTFALVLGAGEPLVLALLAPLSSDGLAGMATLALHRLRVGAARSESLRTRSSTSDRPAPRPQRKAAQPSVATKTSVPSAGAADELSRRRETERARKAAWRARKAAAGG